MAPCRGALARVLPDGDVTEARVVTPRLTVRRLMLFTEMRAARLVAFERVTAEQFRQFEEIGDTAGDFQLLVDAVSVARNAHLAPESLLLIGDLVERALETGAIARHPAVLPDRATQIAVQRGRRLSTGVVEQAPQPLSHVSLGGGTGRMVRCEPVRPLLRQVVADRVGQNEVAVRQTLHQCACAKPVRAMVGEVRFADHEQAGNRAHHWLVETPAWEAMREAGRYITAIGPALLTSRVTDEAVVRVECEELGGEGQPYHGPAIKAGVLARAEGGWFAVVVNQDIHQTRAGRLLIDADPARADAGLHDLYELSDLGPAAQTRPAIELEPGDGRIFFVGTQEQADEVIAHVRGGHYDNELPLYEIDLELAQANGCDVQAAVARARAAAAAYEAGDVAAAHEGLLEARALVAEAIAANEALSSALQAIEAAHDLLSELAQAYRDNFDVVVPPEDRAAVRRGATFVNTRDPQMQGYVDATAEAFLKRLLLEDRLYAGEAPQASAEARQLQAIVQRLHAEAMEHLTAQAR